MSTTERGPWQLAVAREARAAPELAAFITVVAPLLARSPRGDGHHVIVLPGLGGGDTSTAPLRWFLDRLGYRSHGWGLGTNRGFGRQVTAGLDDLLARCWRESGGPVSLVGWSLGGIHAVGLARRRTGAIRDLVTLGSPLSGVSGPLPAVPMTSVYSRSDAIVPWSTSLLPTGLRRESVQVRGSHLGLGHNPGALVVVADRLAQAVDEWRPFAAPRWARRWIPGPADA